MDTALIALGIAFVNLSIGVIVLIRGNGLRLARHFFIISVYSALWGLFEYLSLTAANADSAWLFGGFRTVASYIAIISVLHFAFRFTGNSSKKINVVISLCYSTVALLIYGRFFTSLLVSQMEYTNGHFQIIPGILYVVPVVILLILALVTVVVLRKYYTSLSDISKKQQTGLILYGTATFLVIAIVTYGVLPLFGIKEQVVGVLSMGVFPLAIGVALLRFDLQTSLSFVRGSIQSKVFTAAMAATFVIIIPALIFMNVIYVRDLKSRVDIQLREDVVERSSDLSNYFSDLQDHTSMFALAEGNTTEVKDLIEEIEETARTQTAIETLSIVTSNGDEVIGAGKYHKEISEWIGEITILEPHVLGVANLSTGSFMVVIAPIAFESGNAQKFMVLTVSASRFYELSSETDSSLFNTGKSFVLDGSGKLLTPYGNYDESLVNTTYKSADQESCTKSNLLKSAFFTYLDRRNIPVIAKGVSLPVNDWCLVVEVNKEEVEGSQRMMTVSTLAICMLSVIFVTLIAEMIGSFISRPINLLKKGVSRIITGDFSTPVAVQSDDEIGELSQSFDKMTFELRDARDNVAKKVRIQTQSLEEQKDSLITQQKQMVSLLTELEDEKEKSDILSRDLEKFKQSVDYASDHIIITDPEGYIVYANNAVHTITGFYPKDVIGQKAGSRENWGGTMPQEFYKKLWKTIKIDKKPFKGEIHNTRKNGTPYTVYSNVSPVLDDNNNILFFIGLERDITKEKAIDKAKSEFVSLASHQLRTPLSAINWYSEMLLDGDAGKLNKEQKKFMTEIYEGNQRMIDLVSALLNVSRLELGTFMVEPTPQSLKDLAESAIKELTPLISTKKMNVITKFGKLPKISVDKKLMYIIFQNLFSNAVKYTPEGGKVKIELSKEGSHVLITVADSGMGIPKEEIGKLFEKLFRASNAKEKAIEGTGLGLYMIKEILESTGGKIEVASELGKGSVFSVKMPLAGMKAKVGSKKLI